LAGPISALRLSPHVYDIPRIDNTTNEVSISVIGGKGLFERIILLGRGPGLDIELGAESDDDFEDMSRAVEYGTLWTCL
jgi:hypothetical protein